VADLSMDKEALKLVIRKTAGVLFPIRLASCEAMRPWNVFDADAGEDSAREIREYYVPDFSNWQDEGLFTTGSLKNCCMTSRLSSDQQLLKHSALYVQRSGRTSLPCPGAAISLAASVAAAFRLKA
jgi:hypothetical protein